MVKSSPLLFGLCRPKGVWRRPPGEMPSPKGFRERLQGEKVAQNFSSNSLHINGLDFLCKRSKKIVF